MLSYPPILRGLLVVLSASAAFPVAGVWVVRLNLLPYRFMLMHGALLGGAVALALNFSPIPMLILANLVLVLFADLLANRGRLDAGLVTIFLMVASLGGAMALIYATGIPAQDALGLLWGNVFAVSPGETAATLLFCAGLVLFTRIYGLQIQAVIFDRDIARTAGVNDSGTIRILLIVIALTVAFAMRILGALLLDALLLVPVIIATVGSRSLAGLYRRSVAAGLVLGFAGFAIALATDLPVGASTALLGAPALGTALTVDRFRKGNK